MLSVVAIVTNIRPGTALACPTGADGIHLTLTSATWGAILDAPAPGQRVGLATPQHDPARSVVAFSVTE